MRELASYLHYKKGAGLEAMDAAATVIGDVPHPLRSASNDVAN